MKTFEAMLSALNADIICFQGICRSQGAYYCEFNMLLEMKISKSSLDRPLACPGAFQGYFSFPVSNKGYSGVATYVNTQSGVRPLKAEDGLSGLNQGKSMLSAQDRISDSSSYPSTSDEPFDFFPEDDGTTPADLQSAGLDNEGRTIIIDCGLFVLINVYCPAETSESRLPFKMNFHRLLEARVQSLIDERREVLVVGDINVASKPIDHGEGSLASRQTGFWDHPPRAWFKAWLKDDGGPMIDVVRMFQQGREGMFTC